MIAFATGGLLGDVFLHLVPHAFFGEGQEEGSRAVVVEEKRNIIIGRVSSVTYACELTLYRGSIFVGFMAFFVLDKTMRVLSANAGEDGEHSHSHSDSHVHAHMDKGEAANLQL